MRILAALGFLLASVQPAHAIVLLLDLSAPGDPADSLNFGGMGFGWKVFTCPLGPGDDCIAGPQAVYTVTSDVDFALDLSLPEEPVINGEAGTYTFTLAPGQTGSWRFFLQPAGGGGLPGVVAEPAAASLLVGALALLAAVRGRLNGGNGASRSSTSPHPLRRPPG